MFRAHLVGPGRFWKLLIRKGLELFPGARTHAGLVPFSGKRSITLWLRNSCTLHDAGKRLVLASSSYSKISVKTPMQIE